MSVTVLRKRPAGKQIRLRAWDGETVALVQTIKALQVCNPENRKRILAYLVARFS
jgi:hypothetical protein